MQTMTRKVHTMEILLIVSFALLIIGSLGGSSTVRAEPRDQTRSYYDRGGSLAGSSVDHGKDASFYDRDGKFSGSAIRNSDGTTSFYDKSGHFTGSSKSTTQPR
jgi:hypothetical protein